MPSARQIREELYFITWNFKDWGDSVVLPNANTVSRGQVLVKNLPEIFGSCRLNYELDESEEKFILEVEPKFCAVITPSKLNAVLVLASHNGIQQQMTLSHSKTKWVTCFSVYYDTFLNYIYDYTEENIGFDILFDLNPDCAPTLKKGPQFIQDTLLNLWESKTLSDVTFKCRGKNFPAHTNILASSSPVLAAMFLNDFKEKRERIVEITDFDPPVFENLLRYLYTGEVFGGNNRPAIKHVENLFAAADKYAIESLKEDCEVHLSKNLTLDNMTRYLVLAHRHNSTKLHELTLDFIAKNATKTVCSRKKTDWMEIIKPYPELAFQVMERLAGNKERRTDKPNLAAKKRTRQSMAN